MNKRKNFNILLTCGTRPEIIKMFPIIAKLKENKHIFNTFVLDTGQHPNLSIPLYNWFQIIPDSKLGFAPKNQRLGISISKILELADIFLTKNSFDFIFVQGDTNSALALSLIAHYHKIPVGHIEAGLRTKDRYIPFPEEMNRRLIGELTSLHFPPTKISLNNLVNENLILLNNVIYGNTGVDSLYWTLKKKPKLPIILNKEDVLIFCTLHRRENQQFKAKKIFKYLNILAKKKKNIKILLPVHPNPSIKEALKDLEKKEENFIILNPLTYPETIACLNRANLIITDSGGIQEEASVLGKKTFILREFTERPEVLMKNWIECIGCTVTSLEKNIEQFLLNIPDYNQTKPSSLLGDGNAANKIVEKLKKYLKK